MLLFVLKQKDVELAAAEAKSSLGWGWWKDKTRPVDGTLLLDVKKVPQLALTRHVTKVAATCAPGNLRTTLSSLKLRIKGKYKVVLTKQAESGHKERELAALIWDSQENPRVDMESPDTIIDIIITSKAAYVGTRAWTNQEEFESRRAHLRPEMHPSTLHPSLARALVNLTCAKRLHDAFCGSGGMLIEAGLSHRQVTGADIDPQMIAAARKNCGHYRLHPELRVADATMWLPRTQAVIGDLPYGRNTRPVALQPLYEAFLLRARQSTKRAVVGLPCALPAPQGWAVRAHFTVYVHKSMTKHFYVLEAQHGP